MSASQSAQNVSNEPEKQEQAAIQASAQPPTSQEATGNVNLTSTEPVSQSGHASVSHTDINTTTPLNGHNAVNGIDGQKIDSTLSQTPDRIKFAYWVPNVSGGLVISKIPQRTNWDLDSNITYAQTAERVGFEYALSQIRFMAGYGAENQHEPVSFSQALLQATKSLKVIAALLPGPWNPAIAAKQIASIDHYSKGRIAVNVVSGWFKAEFTAIGQWWLDHAERYRRSREFIACLKGIWVSTVYWKIQETNRLD